MGWFISNMVNTAVVPEEARGKLAVSLVDRHCEAFDWYEDELPTEAQALRMVFADDKFYFDIDAMEHMDYITDDPVTCQLIADTGADGRICFGSLEGDNSGTFWGAEFSSGKFRRLSGRINWMPK